MLYFCFSRKDIKVHKVSFCCLCQKHLDDSHSYRVGAHLSFKGWLSTCRVPPLVLPEAASHELILSTSRLQAPLSGRFITYDANAATWVRITIDTLFIDFMVNQLPACWLYPTPSHTWQFHLPLILQSRGLGTKDAEINAPQPLPPRSSRLKGKKLHDPHEWG